MRSHKICTPHQILIGQATKNERWARHVALGRGERSVYRIFVAKTRWKQTLGVYIGVHKRITLKWLFKTYGKTDWIDRDKCRNRVNGVLKFLIPYNVGISWLTVEILASQGHCSMELIMMMVMMTTRIIIIIIIKVLRPWKITERVGVFWF
jgi:hypothetical protein